MNNYDYYRIFYYVAKYQSFTKAAELLNNSQPNLTRYMNNLEHSLDCKLFVRTNRGAHLTPEGEKLYRHIAIAFEHIYAGEEELRKDHSLESGQIIVAASETALRLYLLSRLERFHEKYPHVRLKLVNYSTPQAVESLENGLVDFAVVTTPLDIKEPVRKVYLHTFREVLLGGSKYRQLSAVPHSLQELADIPLISLGMETGTRRLYIQYYAEHGLDLAPDMEAATTDQILPLIEHNLGIGYYPEELAEKAVAHSRVFSIPLKEPLPVRHVCLVWDSARPKSIAAKKMLEVLMKDRQA